MSLIFSSVCQEIWPRTVFDDHNSFHIGKSANKLVADQYLLNFCTTTLKIPDSD